MENRTFITVEPTFYFGFTFLAPMFPRRLLTRSENCGLLFGWIIFPLGCGIGQQNDRQMIYQLKTSTKQCQHKTAIY